MSITADISKPDDVQRMTDSVVSKWGAIHIACNNAGINMNSASEDTSLDEWDQTFNVNLRGTFMCCQVCVCVCVWSLLRVVILLHYMALWYISVMWNKKKQNTQVS